MPAWLLSPLALKAAVAALLLSLAFAGGYRVASNKAEAQRVAAVEAALRAEKKAGAEYRDSVEAALVAAVGRETALQADLDALRVQSSDVVREVVSGKPMVVYVPALCEEPVARYDWPEFGRLFNLTAGGLPAPAAAAGAAAGGAADLP